MHGSRYLRADSQGEIAMAKADFAIGPPLRDLVTDAAIRNRVFEMRVRNSSAPPSHSPVTGQKELLETNPSSSIVRLRNPYVDPLSLIQGRLAAPKRPPRIHLSIHLSTHPWTYAIGATMNGIAAGLHNTG